MKLLSVEKIDDEYVWTFDDGDQWFGDEYMFHDFLVFLNRRGVLAMTPNGVIKSNNQTIDAINEWHNRWGDEW